MPITPRDALFLRKPRVPFVDEARPQAQTGVRQHFGQDDVALRQLGHEAKAASSGRTQVGSNSCR